jgi:hypothetical protein
LQPPSGSDWTVALLWSLSLGHCFVRFVAFRGQRRPFVSMCTRPKAGVRRCISSSSTQRHWAIAPCSLSPWPLLLPLVSPCFTQTIPSHPCFRPIGSASVQPPNRNDPLRLTSALPPGSRAKTPGRAAPKFPLQAQQTTAWGTVSTAPVFRPQRSFPPRKH